MIEKNEQMKLLNYNKVLPTNHKPHKPLSPDIEDEVRDLADMADIHFTPDFDPDKKWIRLIN